MSKIVVLSFLVLASLAMAGEPQRMIKVKGEAEITVTPDSGEVEFGIVVRDKTLEKTESRLKEKLASVEKAILAVGLPKGATRASDMRIRPLHGYGDKRAQELGYEASKDYTIVVSDLSKMRLVLDSLLKAGVNDLDGIYFKTSKEAELKARVLSLAAKNALLKARAVANALNTTVGKVLTVVEDSYEDDDWGDDDWGDDDDDDFGGGGDEFGDDEPEDAEIPEGKLTISMTVFVIFELKN